MNREEQQHWLDALPRFDAVPPVGTLAAVEWPDGESVALIVQVIAHDDMPDADGSTPWCVVALLDGKPLPGSMETSKGGAWVRRDWLRQLKETP